MAGRRTAARRVRLPVPVTPFRRQDGLLVVAARIWGKTGARDLQLAFDTAASETLVRPELLEDIGYGLTDALYRTSIQSAIGKEPGFMLRVPRFWSLGFEVRDHQIHAHALPDQYDIDGLLGLRFLDRFDYTVQSRRCAIVSELSARRADGSPATRHVQWPRPRRTAPAKTMVAPMTCGRDG